MMQLVREWCQDVDMTCKGNEIQIKMARDRSHKVEIEDKENELVIEGKVHGSYKADDHVDFLLKLWEKNRSIDFCSFSCKESGLVVGRAVIPKIGLTKEMLQTYVRKVAVECDRLEYLLTGKDNY